MSFRNHHSIIFRRAAWIAVLSIMLQVMMPLIHSSANAMPTNGSIHHCSLIKKIAVERAGSQGAPAQKSPSCPVCQTLNLMSGGFVVPHGILLALVSYDVQRVVSSLDEPTLQNEFYFGARSRAPPTLA